MNLWGTSYYKTIEKIAKEVAPNNTSVNKIGNCTRIKTVDETKANVSVEAREWNKDDIDYWNSYGITLKWLKFAKNEKFWSIILKHSRKSIRFWTVLSL